MDLNSMVVSMVHFYRAQQELTLSVLFVEIKLFCAVVAQVEGIHGILEMHPACWRTSLISRSILMVGPYGL